jgi:maltose alpha-D-glucosyltransferase/alpha-amylase
MVENQSWYANAVFYHIDIRAFQDSNGDGYGDLPRLIARLGYLQDLGVDCLRRLPIFPAILHGDD